MSTTEQKFMIQKFYTKDVSFESPEVPEVFNTEWKPEMNLDVHTSSKFLGNDEHEVTIHLTVTVKSQNKVAFLVEIKQ
ncbi:MAG: protein-export chaperone SecB, partial [Legionellales bacterium]|nr:protein-export chaperone SecB [Legionellales bacterium]